MKKSKKDDLDYKDGKAIGRAEVEVEQEMGKELVYIPKELAPYSDGQTYSKEKIYAELEVFSQHEALHAQGLTMARIDMGKRLIILHEISGVPVLHGGDRRSKEFESAAGGLKAELEQRFPWMTPQRKSEYMAVARAAVENPGRFKEWLTGGKNWKKGLALIRNLEDKELKALNAGEAVHGVTLDEFDTISREEIVELCRKQKAQINKGKKQVEAKNREIERLQQGCSPTEKQFHLQMESFRIQFDSLMDSLDPEVIDLLNKREEEEEVKKLTIRMRAHYLEVLGYIKKSILGTLGMAETIHGTAAMIPENVWHPGEGTEIWNDAINQAPKGQ